jgi:hypothetical protein
MEDVHGGPSGPQLYVLSEEGYEELRHIQTMLVLMAKVTYSEGDNTNGNVVLTIPRVNLYYYFEELAAQIGDALDWVSRENWGLVRIGCGSRKKGRLFDQDAFCAEVKSGMGGYSVTCRPVGTGLTSFAVE